MIVKAQGVNSLGLEQLAPIDLATVLARAELLARVDRKYVVPLDIAREMVAALSASHGALTIDGRATTSYRTTYYDTPDLRCVRDHIKRRRRRFKARSRLYVEDGLCRLEIKTKSPRGATLKSQWDIPVQDYGRLSPLQQALIDDALRDAHVPSPGPLSPSLEVSCRRGTLVDLDAGVRVTVDSDIRAVHGGGSVAVDRGHVVVETKGGTRLSQADRLLHEAGCRPQPFSKYASAGSLLDAGIPSNDVHRMVGRQLHRYTHLEGVAS
jgi:hypothetical protein